MAGRAMNSDGIIKQADACRKYSGQALLLLNQPDLTAFTLHDR